VVPRSGAEYAYFIEAFGKLHPFWGPLPSFVCAWVYVMVLRPAEVAVIVLTFSQYVFQPFEEAFVGQMDTERRETVLKLIALTALGKRLIN
jgi:solute carrier family 7 (L-type amino acid transporter), member 9/15